VLARLHLNTFKVDAVLPLDWGNAYAAAAAMLQADGSSGSALYLLASLFNHSCEPCVNVTFPNNDGTAVYTAARRISAGEQLFITYTDTQQVWCTRDRVITVSITAVVVCDMHVSLWGAVCLSCPARQCLVMSWGKLLMGS